MDYFFKRTKNIKDFLTGSNGEDNFESFSYEDLLKKSSEFDLGNKKMEEKIKELEKENNFLNNIIINNSKHSEYSNFLALMESNLLNMKNEILSNNNYSITEFKNFLYNEKFFLGSLLEDNINYLKKKDKDNKLDWEKHSENFLNNQEILQKNLKVLYSNMFVVKDIKKNKKVIKKLENANEDINDKKNNNKSNTNEKQKNKSETKKKKFMNIYYNNYNGNKNENISDILEDLLD